MGFIRPIYYLVVNISYILNIFHFMPAEFQVTANCGQNDIAHSMADM